MTSACPKPLPDDPCRPDDKGPGKKVPPYGMIRGVAVISGDILALALAAVLAAFPVVLFSQHQADITAWQLLDQEGPKRFPQLVAFSSMLLVWLHLPGQAAIHQPFWFEFRRITLGCAFTLLADGFLQFAMKVDFSRLWVVHTWILAIVLLLLTRRLVRMGLRRLSLWAVPVVVIGTGQRLTETLVFLEDQDGVNYQVTAILGPEELRGSWPGSWRTLVTLNHAKTVILALDGDGREACGDLIPLLALERVPFVAVRSMGGLPVISVEPQHAVGHDLLLLSGQSLLAHPLGWAGKVAMDYLGAVILLLVGSPAMLAIALWTGLDGPIFYRQSRVGRHGRPFNCYKFRTMVPDADRRLAEMLAADSALAQEWAADHKLRHDPRITAFGRFLRAYSLDELPQLYNVLRGEMSLVGPRPVTTAELERFGNDLPFYLETKPGLSGLWQVSGRSTLNYHRRIQLNAWYVKNWSPWIDAVILLRTLATVILRRGAW